MADDQWGLTSWLRFPLCAMEQDSSCVQKQCCVTGSDELDFNPRYPVRREDEEEPVSPKTVLSRSKKSLTAIFDENGSGHLGIEAVDCRPAERDSKRSGIQAPSLLMEHRFSRREPFQNDFANKLLSWFWPYISEYISNTIREIVEPALKRALSAAFSSLGSSFAFDPNRCHLGSTPVEVDRLDGHQSTQGDLNNVCFTAVVKWEGKPEVFFTMSKMELGVKDVRFEGIVRVECVGMQPKPLFFEGMRMFLVNPPKMAITFEGSFHSWLNYASIKSMIIDTVADKIAERVVVPNRVAKLMSSEADWFQVAHPVPEGVLMITVLNCEKLPASDVNFLRANSSDPYVVVSSGAHKFKSVVMKRNLNPKFNFACRFFVASVHEQYIDIEIRDHDKVSKDDFLGKLSIPVLSIRDWQEGKFCFQLEDEQGESGKNGKIWLSAEYFPILKHMHTADGGLQDSLNGVDPNGSVYIFAGVYNCSHVPQMKDGTKFWVEVNCDGAWNSPGGSPIRMSEKLSQHGANWLNQDRAVREALLRKKLGLLQKYNVSSEDVAQILEVDPSQLEAITEKQSLGISELLFNSGFDYIVDDLEKTVVSFTLKCQAEDKSKASKKEKKANEEERILGSFCASGAELLREPMYLRTLTLKGSNILMKVLMQLRMLA